MPVQFPPETVDRIIDHLWSDPHTLTQTALVAHDWLPASRYHLYSGLITLNNRAAFHRFSQFWGDPRPTSSRELVHALLIEEQGRPWGHEALFYLPRQLPNLRELYLSGVRYDRNFFLARGVSQLLKLRELELSNCRFDGVPEFWRFLCAFPSLTRLSVYNVYYQPRSTFYFARRFGETRRQLPPPDVSTLPRLSFLRIEADSHMVSGLFRLLLDTPTVDSLHTLDIRSSRYTFASETARMIHRLGHILDDLRLTLSQGAVSQLPDLRRSLSFNTKLRWLFLHYQSSAYGFGLPYLLDELHPSVRIRELTLVIDAFDPEFFDLTSVANTLATVQFSELNTVECTGFSSQLDIVDFNLSAPGFRRSLSERFVEYADEDVPIVMTFTA